MIRQALKSIQERYIANRSAEKEWEMASQAYMPMKSSVLAEFVTDIEKAYHTTDLDGLKSLKKLQGKKKTISAFSKGSKGLGSGARTETEVLVTLSGKSTFQAETDFYSSLSRNGYKWLKPTMTEKDYVVNNGFSVPMNKKMIKYFKVEDRFEVRAAAEKLDGKGKANFIKWYFDESKKLITKKLLAQIQASIAKSYKGDYDNDELFLHEIKILEVDVVRNRMSSRTSPEEREQGWLERRDIIKGMGLKFGGFIDPEDVSNLGR